MARKNVNFWKSALKDAALEGIKEAMAQTYPGAPLKELEFYGDESDYHFALKLPTTSGPRYFEVRVKESIS